MQHSGLGWTADRVREAVENEGARLVDFNERYMKIHLRKPAIETQSIVDPLNRFFAEGAPEYGPPSLVPIEIAKAALVPRARSPRP